jgi:hypothetical protein
MTTTGARWTPLAWTSPAPGECAPAEFGARVHEKDRNDSMIAAGNDLTQLVLALGFVIASGYAAGRVHQWYKQGLERDSAFRLGYNWASLSMFDMVLRVGRSAPRAATADASLDERPAGGPGSRTDRPHRAIARPAVGSAPVTASPDADGSSRRSGPHAVVPPGGRRRRHTA